MEVGVKFQCFFIHNSPYFVSRGIEKNTIMQKNHV
jgi:hypothetical protein